MRSNVEHKIRKYCPQCGVSLKKRIAHTCNPEQGEDWLVCGKGEK